MLLIQSLLTQVRVYTEDVQMDVKTITVDMKARLAGLACVERVGEWGSRRIAARTAVHA